MGLLKNVVLAFKPSSIKQGLAAARNPLDQAAIEESLQSLTPEQRAAYDANMAEVERGRQESQKAWEEAKAISDGARVLDGPAGRYLYGSGMNEFPSPAELEARIAEKGALPVVGELRAQRKGEFKQGVRQAFGKEEVEQEKDPIRREQIAAEEVQQRAEARAPYRAADAVTVESERVATRGETQLAEVIEHLRTSGHAARPDLVFGVYRVPDRISGPLTPHSEKGRVVEWEIVHAPRDPGDVPASDPPEVVATSFAGEDQWVARRYGEPSVLDEDLALAFCEEARLGPERCLGLARFSEFRSLRGEGSSEDGSGDLRAIVRGIVVLHPAERSGAFDRMRDAAPLDLPIEPRGVCVDVLDWETIGRAVHLRIHRPHSVPSPFPYLPSTPQELMRAYLEVVGVKPHDCYGAQATVDRPSALIQGGFFSTNLGPKQPCADGKPRMRTHACQQIVVAYRDSPEYVAGRERWAAYEREVLQAQLRNGVRLRPTIVTNEDDLSDIPTSVLRAAFRVGQFIDAIEEWGSEKVLPYRYCWPPVDEPA